MPTERVIQREPDVLGGTPVFVGTRVPVQTFFDYLAAGETLDGFLDDFPTVDRAHAIGALEEMKRVLLSERQ